MARHGGTDPELSLAIRAAWLHYAGGLTQAAVASGVEREPLAAPTANVAAGERV